MKLNESKKTEAVLDLPAEIIQLITQAALLTAGFHSHKRQWRRKRKTLRRPITAKPGRPLSFSRVGPKRAL